MALDKNNKDIAYIAGRMLAIVEYYAHGKFGPNTLSNGFSHPTSVVNTFGKYIDTNDVFFEELKHIDLPVTTKNEIDKSRMWIGYYHQKAAYSDILSKKDIRERIKWAMSYYNMKQKSLAEAVGVTPQYINNFLNNRQPISLTKLEKIFIILGL